MIKLLIKWGVLTLALWVLATYTPAIHVAEPITLVYAALALGLLNALLRPILKIVSFPITIITLGLFTFVINGAMLALVPYIVSGITVTSFLWAMVGAFAISIITGILNHLLIGEDD